MSVRTPTISRDTMKDLVGGAVVAGAAALTGGAAAIPAAIAKSWFLKQAVHTGADVLSKTIAK